MLETETEDDEFEASRGCIDRPSLKNEIQNQTDTKTGSLKLSWIEWGGTIKSNQLFICLLICTCLSFQNYCISSKVQNSSPLHRHQHFIF